MDRNTLNELKHELAMLKTNKRNGLTSKHEDDRIEFLEYEIKKAEEDLELER